MERVNRRFILKATVLVPVPVSTLAFVGHQIDDASANLAGATFGAAYGAVFAGIKTIDASTVDDSSSQSLTRHDFRNLFSNLAKYMLVGAAGGFLSINLKRINPYYRH